MFFKRSRKGTRAILIADVVGSTALYEELGDQEAQKLVTARLDQVAAVVADNKGRVVKSMGDGLLCAFPEAKQAFRTVTHLVPVPSGEGASRLALRVGVHLGTVVEERKDIFGDSVNTAARLAALARPGEVIVSRVLIEALPAAVGGMIRALAPVAVKGKAEPVEVYTLVSGLYETASTATVAVSTPATRGEVQVVHISGALGQATLGPDDLRLVIGRDEGCTLQIDEELVSRRHITIERRADRVVLVDASTNGTWLVPDGQPGVRLLREESRLHGRGTLGLGAAPGEGQSPSLRYEVHEPRSGSPG